MLMLLWHPKATASAPPTVRRDVGGRRRQQSEQEIAGMLSLAGRAAQQLADDYLQQIDQALGRTT